VPDRPAVSARSTPEQTFILLFHDVFSCYVINRLPKTSISPALSLADAAMLMNVCH
jgi:hypothetical protein